MPRYSLKFTDNHNRAVETLVRECADAQDAKRIATDILWRGEHPSQKAGVVLFRHAELTLKDMN